MPSFDPNKYGLALHTTSPQLGLAISNFADDTRASTWDLGRDLSSDLHQYLVEFLSPQTWADLAFIAVAKGPGGFTGTRIGVVTARTLAQQLDIPLFAISTLAAVAWSHLLQSSTPPTPLGKGGVQATSLGQGGVQATPLGKGGVQATPLGKGGVQEAIALQMPAQRGQLFTAIYQLSPSGSGLTALFPDAVVTPEEWQQTLDTWQSPYELIDIPAGGGLGDSVASLLKLAYWDWQQGKRPHWPEALPFYGQHPVNL